MSDLSEHLTLLCFYRLNSWIPLSISYAECVMNQQQDSTLEPSLVRDVNHSLVELAITNQWLQNARITIVVWWTKRTGPLAKLADLENVWWLGCPNLGQDMEEDQTGSRFTVSCKLTVTRDLLHLKHHIHILQLLHHQWPLSQAKRVSCLQHSDGLWPHHSHKCLCLLSKSHLQQQLSPCQLSRPMPTCWNRLKPSWKRRLKKRKMILLVFQGLRLLQPKFLHHHTIYPQSLTLPLDLVTVFSLRRIGIIFWKLTRTLGLLVQLVTRRQLQGLHHILFFLLAFRCLSLNFHHCRIYHISTIPSPLPRLPFIVLGMLFKSF